MIELAQMGSLKALHDLARSLFNDVSKLESEHRDRLIDSIFETCRSVIVDHHKVLTSTILRIEQAKTKDELDAISRDLVAALYQSKTERIGLREYQKRLPLFKLRRTDQEFLSAAIRITMPKSAGVSVSATTEHITFFAGAVKRGSEEPDVHADTIERLAGLLME
jgi:hypothetical protein